MKVRAGMSIDENTLKKFDEMIGKIPRSAILEGMMKKAIETGTITVDGIE